MRAPERAAGPQENRDASASVVHEYIAPAPGRHVVPMLLATTIVAVFPLAVSLALRATGAVSGWVSVGLAVAMSLVSSTAGSTYWRKRGGHSEVLFGELLLWGWIRSWRQERELANATRLLGLVNRPAHGDERDELSVEEREHLLRQLAGALEGQDVYLNGHSRRVARHATMIARGMGLSSQEVARIRAAAAVHDVGKLLTPKAILNKPGRLTDAEFEVIKLHPVDGAEMVAALGDPELTRIVRHHHERLDGAGYPDRLEGEAIPVGARIIAVADTFDAITSARPYRDAAPHQKAIDILRKEAGTQLDPEAVRAFLAYYSSSRPTVVWALITSSVRRLVSWLTGDPAAAATISASKVAAATAATAAIGAAAASAPVPVPVVHHHAARSAVVRSVPVRAHGAAAGLRRHGVSVVVPAVSPAPASHAHVRRAAKALPAKTRRGHAAQGTAPNRHHAKPSAGTQAHSRATGAGTSSPSGTRGVTGAASGTPASPTSVAAGGQSSGNSGASDASPPSSNPAPASHSQGSNANGNAYGHTKVLGNGHGNGLAKGHDNSSPAQSSPSPAVPSTPVPVPAPAPSSTGSQNASAGGHGNGNGNSKGEGNGNGHSNVNGQGGGTAVVTPSPTPAPSVSAGSDGNGQGNGNGQGHGSDG